MNRRDMVLALAVLGVAPRTATAQERTVRIGILVGRRNSTFMPRLLKRLGEGYVEGRNLTVEYRSADGVLERFPALARELIDATCDVIFAIGAPQAAQALVAAKSPGRRANLHAPFAGRLSASVIFLAPFGNILTGRWPHFPSAACTLTIGREVGATRSGSRALHYRPRPPLDRPQPARRGRMHAQTLSPRVPRWRLQQVRFRSSDSNGGEIRKRAPARTFEHGLALARTHGVGPSLTCGEVLNPPDRKCVV